jgi:hypothetical protein
LVATYLTSEMTLLPIGEMQQRLYAGIIFFLISSFPTLQLFTAIYSDYGYSFGVPEGAEAFDWDANIYNYVLKGDFSYFFNPKSKLDFGAETNFYRFHPGRGRGLGEESIFNEIDIQHATCIRVCGLCKL